MTQADIKKRMLDLGISLTPSSSASFTAYVRDQVETLAPAVKGAGVKL
jgi:tripartite-type tricarboxylate transporter receptor subunit TctC